MKNFFLIIFLSAVGFLGFEIWQNYGLQKALLEISDENLAEVSENKNVKIANPASKFCLKNGGELEIRKSEKDGGEVGFCVFGDETECEEWEFFRGECGTEKAKYSNGIVPEKPDGKSDSDSDKKTPVKMDAELPEELLELLQKNSDSNSDKKSDSDSTEKSDESDSEKSAESDSGNSNEKNAEEISDEKTEEKSDSKTGELEAGKTDSAKSFSDYLDSMNE